MLHIGCHLSVSQGFLHMGKEALSIGADTFQFFTRNPRGGNVRKLDVPDMEALNAFMKEHHFAPILAHAPYTLNGCSKTEKTRDFAYRAMADDLQRLEYLDNCQYNFHPGSHVGQGADVAIPLIADMLNQCMFAAQKTGLRNRLLQKQNFLWTASTFPSLAFARLVQEKKNIIVNDMTKRVL